MDAAAFVREARITGRLPHPGIPPVYALGELPDGRPFLAMKLIRGDTLDKVLKARGTDLTADRGRLLAAFEQMCHAVGYAHAQGIIHRDLKPSNVMVGAFGEVQVMDWGLAKETRSAEGGTGNETTTDSAVPRSALPDPRYQATVAGQIKGTPAYMAPEQARGEPVDARADVFALGGILAAILTGHPPFAGNSVLDTILRAAQAELGETFARLDASGADADLLALCKKCLAANRDDRFADARELAQAVAAYRAEVEARLMRAERERAAAEERRKRRRTQWALAASLLLLLVAGGVGAAFASLWRTAETQRDVADIAMNEALIEKGKSELAKAEAEKQRTTAEKAEGVAVEQKRIAEQAKTNEEIARKQAEFEREKSVATEYGRTIEVAQRECRDSNYTGAKSLFETTPSRLRGWEYHYVQRLSSGGFLLSFRNGTGLSLRPSASFSPDGHCILTVGDWVEVRDAGTGKSSLRLECTPSTFSAQFSPNGKHIITAAHKRIGIWNATTGACMHTLPGFRESETIKVYFSNDSKKAYATGRPDFDVPVCYCWDVETGNPIAPEKADIAGKTKSHGLQAVSADGTKVATGNTDYTVKLREQTSGNDCTLAGHTKAVTSLDFSPDGTRTVTASEDGTVKIRDAQIAQSGRLIVRASGSIAAVAFSPDGSRILIGTANGVASVLDARVGSRLHIFENHIEAVGAVTYSQDGKYIIVGDSSQFVNVYQSSSGQLLRTLRGHLFGTSSASFSAKGDYILTCGENIARMRNAVSGTFIRDFEGHTNSVRTGQFSTDGEWVITGSEDRTARIWHVGTGEVRFTLAGHAKSVTSVAFSRDGTRVATASEDGTAKVWDARTGKELLLLKGHTGSLRAVAINPDDSRVVTASDGGTAKVWDIKTGVMVITLKGHTAGLSSVTFSADGKRIVTGSKDQTARIWDARSGAEILAWLTPPPLALAPAPRAK
jgi:WD40 repeat protein